MGVPDKSLIRDGEIVVEILSVRDERGRYGFFASWLDDQKPGGVASQRFTTNLREFIEREERNGHSVVGLTDHDGDVLRTEAGDLWASL